MTHLWLISALNAALLVHSVCRLSERKYSIGETRLWAFAAMAAGAAGGVLYPSAWAPYVLIQIAVVLIGLSTWNPLAAERRRSDRRAATR